MRQFLLGEKIAAHTEFTRLVAEHGILGLFALLIALYLGWSTFKQARNIHHRALVASLLVYTLLFMLVNAFRIVIPAFAFGLTFAQWHLDKEA